jgi:hypothetical protein
MMSSRGTFTAAFALSLAGGVLMLLSGGMAWMWFMFGTSNFGGMMGGMMDEFEGMMGGYHDMMDNLNVPAGSMTILSLLGLLSGIAVIIAAIMLNTRPREHVTWGTIILVFSIISLVGMGGFWIGALLGIAGGAIALSWRPKANIETRS